MTKEEELVNLAWKIGACQHLDAVRGMHRNAPNANTEQWLAEARADMRKLNARRVTWNASVTPSGIRPLGPFSSAERND